MIEEGLDHHETIVRLQWFYVVSTTEASSRSFKLNYKF